MRPCRVAKEESAPAGVGRQAAATPSWQLAVVRRGAAARRPPGARTTEARAAIRLPAPGQHSRCGPEPLRLGSEPGGDPAWAGRPVAGLGVPSARCLSGSRRSAPEPSAAGNNSRGMHGRSLGRPRRSQRAVGRAPCAEASKARRRARFSHRGPAKKPHETTEVGCQAQSGRAKLLAPSRWKSSRSGLLTASRQKSGSEISHAGQDVQRRTDGTDSACPED